jgi:4-hydroxy-2-oxoheptanedioate aldolase
MTSAPLSALARRIRAGEPSYAAWCLLGDPAIAETLVRAGFDSAVLDMQHGTFTVATAMHAIAAVAAAGAPAMVRIPVGEFSTAARLLDAGAAGVIAPMIDSVAEARRLASLTKYPPLGERSWGPMRALPLSGLAAGDFFARANDLQLVVAMIETRAALEAVDEILAVPGIDGVLVGPADLSVALTGGPPDVFHPDVERALDRVVRAARAARKFAAHFCMSGKQARAMLARGFALCSVSTDSALLAQAARAELANPEAGDTTVVV